MRRGHAGDEPFRGSAGPTSRRASECSVTRRFDADPRGLARAYSYKGGGKLKVHSAYMYQNGL